MGGRAKPTSRRATGEQRGSSRACVWERSAKHASNGVAKLAAQCPKMGETAKAAVSVQQRHCSLPSRARNRAV